VLITLGKIKSAVLINWLQVIFFAVGVFLLLPGADALQMAAIRVVTVLAGFFLSIWMLIRTLTNVSVLDIVRTVSRPLLATGAMAVAVISIGEATHFSALFELLLKVAIGMLTFPTAVILMWILAGRPQGPESYLLGKAQLMLPKRKHQ
jgi:hypothetical protein